MLKLKTRFSHQHQTLQKKIKAPLTINDAIAKSSTSRNTNFSPPDGSQHFYGRAIDIDITGFGNNDRIRLVDAAIESGFTGFGLGKNILHLDLRPQTKTGKKRDAWNYSNTNFAGKSFENFWNSYIKSA